MSVRLLPFAAAALLAVLPGVAGAYGESPLPATEISKAVSLKDAAARRMVNLTSKGNFGGDGVAVDLNWKPLPGPVRVTLRIDFTGFSNPAAGKAPLELAVRKGVAEMNRLVPRGPGLPKVAFDVQFTVSGKNAPQPPGYHQITLDNNPDFRSYVTGDEPPNGPTGDTGIWSTADLFRPSVFAHEALHLAGLPDRYKDVYTEPGTGRRVTAPETGLNTRAEIDAWARAHVPPLRPGGPLRSVPNPGAGCDVMATTDAGCRRISRKDLLNFAAQAGVRLQAPAGDLLANKAGDQQNLGVGEPLELFAPRNGKAHADGLVVYCINLSRHIPERGTELDVLGPASSLGTPGAAQLQAVLERIAAIPRSPTDVLGAREGGQLAVWAVTDPTDSLSATPSPPALAILSAARVDLGARPGLPPYTNPNAATPGTAALGADGTVVPQPPEEPAPPPVRIRLEGATLSKDVLRASRVQRVTLTLRITGGGSDVLLRVERRNGGRWRGVGAFPPRSVGAGDVQLGLNMPRLRAGNYRVVAVGPFGTKRVAFSVR